MRACVCVRVSESRVRKIQIPPKWIQEHNSNKTNARTQDIFAIVGRQKKKKENMLFHFLFADNLIKRNSFKLRPIWQNRFQKLYTFLIRVSFVCVRVYLWDSSFFLAFLFLNHNFVAVYVCVCVCFPFLCFCCCSLTFNFVVVFVFSYHFFLTTIFWPLYFFLSLFFLPQSHCTNCWWDLF